MGNADAPFYDELSALLAAVSRSFFLSIKCLPAGVRAPVGLAYLLARASDTIADSAEAPAPLRLKCLAAFREMIGRGATEGGIQFVRSAIVPEDAAERELIAKIPRCLEWLAALDGRDRSDVVEVLGKIIRGQELDVERFADRSTINALQNETELDEYTYLVAGCVGEFWTGICFRHVKNFARLDAGRMRALGANFGKGLQLVNILRDMPADLRAGRCYLPADELARAGVTPQGIADSPQQCRAVFDRWLAQAGAHMDDAFRYIEAVGNRRVRFACVLPWYLGMRTLALMRAKPPLETPGRVKVTRREVRALLLFAPLAACSDTALRAVRRHLSRCRN